MSSAEAFSQLASSAEGAVFLAKQKGVVEWIVDLVRVRKDARSTVLVALFRLSVPAENRVRLARTPGLLEVLVHGSDSNAMCTDAAVGTLMNLSRGLEGNHLARVLLVPGVPEFLVKVAEGKGDSHVRQNALRSLRAFAREENVSTAVCRVPGLLRCNEYDCAAPSSRMRPGGVPPSRRCHGKPFAHVQG